MLHDETENPVHMVKVFEGRLLIRAIPVPNDWKPLARFDQVGADQRTGDEAVKLFEQHLFLAEGEQFSVTAICPPAPRGPQERRGCRESGSGQIRGQSSARLRRQAHEP